MSDLYIYLVWQRGTPRW